MGYYIGTPEPKNKAKQLKELYTAVLVSSKTAYEHIQNPDLAPICVVINKHFEAAGFIYNITEFEAFTQFDDLRPKYWMLMNRKKVEELTGFK